MVRYSIILQLQHFSEEGMSILSRLNGHAVSNQTINYVHQPINVLDTQAYTQDCLFQVNTSPPGLTAISIEPSSLQMSPSVLLGPGRRYTGPAGDERPTGIIGGCGCLPRCPRDDWLPRSVGPHSAEWEQT